MIKRLENNSSGITIPIYEKKINELIDVVNLLCKYMSSNPNDWKEAHAALDTKQEKCPECKGTGLRGGSSATIYNDVRCKTCKGTGTMGEKC